MGLESENTIPVIGAITIKKENGTTLLSRFQNVAGHANIWIMESMMNMEIVGHPHHATSGYGCPQKKENAGNNISQLRTHARSDTTSE